MPDIPGRIFFKDDEVFTDWASRNGDGLVLRAEAIDTNNNSMDLKIEPYTKNAEDTGVGTKIDSGGSSWDLTVDGAANKLGKIQEIIKVSTASIGMKELVRFRISVVNATNASDWLSMRLFPPIFFDASS